jgi:2-polyprenyl-3-methyl-5-hydroxy-6-metoxy-1,4-benzoquinol methylase
MVNVGSRRTSRRAPAGDAFDEVARALRTAVIEHYRRTGERLPNSAWLNTIETNSGYVARRARPMLELLLDRTGLASLHGLDLLDAGCGFGALSAFFAAHGARVIGIDANSPRLDVGREVAARRALDMTLQAGRMEALEFPDRTFDVVVMNNSLCYLVAREDRRSALAEALRVLRPGGHLMIRNPSRLVLRDQFSGLPLIHFAPPDLTMRLAKLLGRHRSHVRLFTPAGARRELRAAGFDAVEHVRLPGARVPNALKAFARYQHLIAVRPRDL